VDLIGDGLAEEVGLEIVLGVIEVGGRNFEKSFCFIISIKLFK